MKVILSRKGFDDQFGEGPSPIVDGKYPVSIPIEYGEKEKVRTFNDLRLGRQNLGVLIEKLYEKRKRHEFCHLDPDLRRDILPAKYRHKNWQPIFGQQGAAAGHLKDKVEEGDIFLFFGYFQESESWNYFKRDAPKLHMIWGWLQVDRVVENPSDWVRMKENSWARTHPHTYGNWWEEPNLLFVTKRNLKIPTSKGYRSTKLPGAGIFKNYDARLVLTDLSPHRGIADARSRWRLPEFFRPDRKGRSISFLQKAMWEKVRGEPFVRMDPGNTRLWQEAVISGNPNAVRWACDLIKEMS